MFNAALIHDFSFLDLHTRCGWRRSFPCPGLKFLFLLLGIITLATHLPAQDTTLLAYMDHPSSVRLVVSDAAGEIWLCTGRGLERYDNKEAMFKIVRSGFMGKVSNYKGEIVDVLDNPELPDGFDHAQYYNWSDKVPYFDNTISVATDATGRLWVCNGKKLFLFVVEERVKAHYKGMSIRGIATLGDKLVANANGKTYLDNKQLFPFSELLADGSVFNKGNEIFSCDGGLLHLDTLGNESRLISLPFLIDNQPFNSNDEHNLIRCGGFWQDTLWLGTMGGLVYQGEDELFHRLGPEMDVKLGVDLGTAFGVVNEEGEVWIKKEERLQEWVLPGNKMVTDLIYSARRGAYYFATNQGLYIAEQLLGPVTDSITGMDGLSSEMLCTLLLEDDRVLWISTYSGINRLDLKTGYLQHILSNVEFNRLSKHMSTNGKLFFGSIDGLYEIDPKAFQTPRQESGFLSKKGRLVLLLSLVLLLFSLTIWYLKTVQSKSNQQLSLQSAQLKQQESAILLLKAENIILSNLHTIDTVLLAEALEMSPRTMHRVFKQLDITPGQMIREIRKRQILKLHQHSGKDLKTIADEVGYTEKYVKQLLEEQVSENESI